MSEPPVAPALRPFEGLGRWAIGIVESLGRFGSFMLTRGTHAVTVHYGPQSLVTVRGQPNTRSLVDPNGNTFVLQAATDAEAAAAGDLAAGKAPVK